MRTVFIDVGGHRGQTLDEVTKPTYCFDRIYCFEPMPEEFAALERAYGSDQRVTLVQAALSDRSGDVPIYGSNERMGATMFREKRNLAQPDRTTVCRAIRASDFFAQHLDDTGTVVMKLNCEGAECIIMNDLLESGQVWKLANVLIDFDVRKIPGMEQDEQTLRARMRAVGFERYSDSMSVMLGPTHQQRIHHWLDGLSIRHRILTPPVRPRRLTDRLRDLRFALRGR
jgi:FkbM family methyltransferase